MSIKMTINISIGQLAEIISNYKNIQLENNKEVDIRDLGCNIDTPTESTIINYIIKKEGLTGYKLILANNVEIKCADEHILRYNNNDIYVKNLNKGDYIETLNGIIKIVDIEKISDTTFYDIGIDAPYLYYDSDGILHHNTLITAILSHKCESYGRTFVIVPNRTLVTQTEKDYINLGLDVGIFFGGKKEYNKTHTICTWQSLNSLIKLSVNGEIATNFNELISNVAAVIVDECFDGNTKITTPNGLVDIKDIKIGDIIINLNENTNTFKNDVIIDVYKNMNNSNNDNMLRIQLDNGTSIDVTENHEFLTTDGWVKAKFLTNEMDIIFCSYPF